MVDKYTKIVLTIIAVGLWVQVGLQINPVQTATAQNATTVYSPYLVRTHDTLKKMEKLQIQMLEHLGKIRQMNIYQEIHLTKIKDHFLKN